MQTPFDLASLRNLWPEGSQLLAVLLFGSRATDIDAHEDADWDVGIVYSGEPPELETPANWDMFYWSKEHWQRGFVLQMELAAKSRILYDPERLIEERFSFIQQHILPHWAGYLRRL